VIGPELRTIAHPLRVDEVLAVFPPRRNLLNRPVHDVDDLRLRPRLLQQAPHVVTLEAIALRDLVDEGHDLGAMQIEARRRRARGLRERGRTG